MSKEVYSMPETPGNNDMPTSPGDSCRVQRIRISSCTLYFQRSIPIRTKMTDTTPIILRLLAASASAADKAGKIVRDIMSSGDLGIVVKGEKDLQTAADRAVQHFIVSSLSKQFPNITIIGEEGELKEDESGSEVFIGQDIKILSLACPAALITVPDDQICVWVDPLDGTQEFTEGLLDHVTILVGIAVGKNPVAGVIHQPYYNYKSGARLGRTIWGLQGGGIGGLKRTQPPAEGRIIATTKSHSTGLVDDVLKAANPSEVLRVGGAGHKVMLLMEGKAHAYVFASPGTKRWDTCAPEAILREMGGELTDIHGDRYDYSSTTKPNNLRGCLATARAAEHSSYVSLLAPAVEGKLL